MLEFHDETCSSGDITHILAFVKPKIHRLSKKIYIFLMNHTYVNMNTVQSASNVKFLNLKFHFLQGSELSIRADSVQMSQYQHLCCEPTVSPLCARVVALVCVCGGVTLTSPLFLCALMNELLSSSFRPFRVLKRPTVCTAPSPAVLHV